MRKVHVVTQKEAVNEAKLASCTAVVIDVFLATSTIAFLLENNYESVYTAKDSQEALAMTSRFDGEYILLGETKGESIAGFQYPDPCLITPNKDTGAAVICSTNGTIAIERAKQAKQLYISSLVNGHKVAERIHQHTDNSSIVLICAGNDDRFSMEDFVGAGQIAEHLITRGEYELSDAAKLARDTYNDAMADSFRNLLECETASLLQSFGFDASMDFVIDHHEKIGIVPVFNGGRIVRENKQLKE
ncbi:2-phosphosulfolactate phosphatase [Indiicoccus explosivorum]|uniref:2-phosphosulfolactate phosphatase n=1 Tax=Indiicoccus explosivorum TaxID=1917864 RepID=UPI000B454643|nr:2-phosphosulfolactate phosphatase [Indiicoccus explosivorum]